MKTVIPSSTLPVEVSQKKPYMGVIPLDFARKKTIGNTPPPREIETKGTYLPHGHGHFFFFFFGGGGGGGGRVFEQYHTIIIIHPQCFQG